MIERAVTLTDIVIDIQQRRNCDEYCVNETPRCLSPVLTAVQHGQAISPLVFFERESSDPHSYLLELALLLRWKFDHPGEYDAIELPEMGWRSFLSHAASSSTTGRSGSTYEVTPLRDR